MQGDRETLVVGVTVFVAGLACALLLFNYLDPGLPASPDRIDLNEGPDEIARDGVSSLAKRDRTILVSRNETNATTGEWTNRTLRRWKIETWGFTNSFEVSMSQRVVTAGGDFWYSPDNASDPTAAWKTYVYGKDGGTWARNAFNKNWYMELRTAPDDELESISNLPTSRDNEFRGWITVREDSEVRVLENTSTEGEGSLRERFVITKTGERPRLTRMAWIYTSGNKTTPHTRKVGMIYQIKDVDSTEVRPPEDLPLLQRLKSHVYDALVYERL